MIKAAVSGPSTNECCLSGPVPNEPQVRPVSNRKNSDGNAMTLKRPEFWHPPNEPMPPRRDYSQHTQVVRRSVDREVQN